MIILVLVGALLYFGWDKIQSEASKYGFQLPFSQLVYEGPESGPLPATKKIAFNVIDDFAGSLLSGTDYIDVCEGSGVILETVTITNGEGTTADAYRTGQVLYLRSRDAAIGSAESAFWVDFTVPGFKSEGDIEANTNFDVTLRSREYTAQTASLYYQNTAITATSGKINKTSGATPGSQSFQLAFRIIEGTDNKGTNPSAYDRINDMQWKTMLYVKAEKVTDAVLGITIDNMDGSVVSGSNKWWWKEVNPDAISRWKVGNVYELAGTLDVFLDMDMGGDSYSNGDSKLMFYLVYRSDPAYFTKHGATSSNFGPHSKNVIDGQYYLLASA